MVKCAAANVGCIQRSCCGMGTCCSPCCATGRRSCCRSCCGQQPCGILSYRLQGGPCGPVLPSMDQCGCCNCGCCPPFYFVRNNCDCCWEWGCFGPCY